MRSLLPALAALLACAAPAAAQTVINSVPFTINSSGRYILGSNLITTSASQTAIRINAPNVILDLNGFFVSGPGNTPDSDVAVIRVTAVSNVTIRNGTVANNGYGIFFDFGANAINRLVENVNVTRCYLSGIRFLGESAGSTVRRCRVSQIGNSTAGPIVFTIGIGGGGGLRLEKNSITGVTATGTGISRGIFLSVGSFAIGNTISGCDVGIDGGKYQNNLTFNCATPFTGGTNAGGND